MFHVEHLHVRKAQLRDLDQMGILHFLFDVLLGVEYLCLSKNKQRTELVWTLVCETRNRTLHWFTESSEWDGICFKTRLRAELGKKYRIFLTKHTSPWAEHNYLTLMVLAINPTNKECGWMTSEKNSDLSLLWKIVTAFPVPEKDEETNLEAILESLKQE